MNYILLRLLFLYKLYLLIMFHKDTRRSDKFKRSDDYFKKTGKEKPKKVQSSIKFNNYTKFLESKENIDHIDINEHMKRMKTYTHYYKYPKSYYSDPSVNIIQDFNKNIITQIFFEKDYTINTAHKYKKNNINKNVCILNFASAKNPGGGFLRGSMAQEESICYVSTLYHSLIQSNMYEINKKNPQNGLYNDIGIYTNEICVFKIHRDDDYIDPFYISVISCPAVNKNNAIDKGISEDKIYDKMCDRIKLIFEIAKSHNVDILILGAFGCGVFGNDINDIKEIFFGLLENDYENIFEKIVFAIPDNDKYESFKK